MPWTHTARCSNELARFEDQIAKHLDTIDRQADLIACLVQASRATRMVAPTFSPAPTTNANRGNAAPLGPS